MAPHVRAICLVVNYIDGQVPDTEIKTHEVEFSNGCRVIAVLATPESARSYHDEVVPGEFAFHQDARNIYETAGPSTTRGYSLSFISTPNGKTGASLNTDIGVGTHRAGSELAFDAIGLGLDYCGKRCEDDDGNHPSIHESLSGLHGSRSIAQASTRS